ncbi:MAG: hypothetical protein JST86_09580 [Bacteroidetes bacterium]|nr:hypothetical protein [Bacteroidota bacterium]
MGWGKWKPDGTGQQKTEKITVNKDGSRKEESLRTNEGSKQDHQHTWIDKDSSGNLKGGGATPGKSSK